MKADEIRNLSDADARARVQELQEEQFRLRFRSATETLEQPLRLRTIRRDIARLLTVLRERELAAQGPTPARTARRRAARRAAKK
jgi:large subunit ribosomal protein L29